MTVLCLSPGPSAAGHRRLECVVASSDGRRQLRVAVIPPTAVHPVDDGIAVVTEETAGQGRRRHPVQYYPLTVYRLYRCPYRRRDDRVDGVLCVPISKYYNKHRASDTTLIARHVCQRRTHRQDGRGLPVHPEAIQQRTDD